jgi:hypothetical protein
MLVVSHQDSRKKSIGRIACLVALRLSPIFTKQLNLQWGIVPQQSLIDFPIITINVPINFPIIVY